MRGNMNRTLDTNHHVFSSTVRSLIIIYGRSYKSYGALDCVLITNSNMVLHWGYDTIKPNYCKSVCWMMAHQSFILYLYLVACFCFICHSFGVCGLMLLWNVNVFRALWQVLWIVLQSCDARWCKRGYSCRK